MKKAVIDDHLHLVQSTLEQWISFRRFMNKAFSDSEIAPDEEPSFLEVKSNVARNIRTITERSKSFPGLDAGDKIIRDMLTKCVSVAHLRALPPADQKVLLKEWHQSFIRLSRSVGALKFLSDGYLPDSMSGKKKKKKGGAPKGVVIGGVVAALAAGGVVVAYFLGYI